MYVLTVTRGWIKIGMTASADRRVADLERQLRARYGLEIVDVWRSEALPVALLRRVERKARFQIEGLHLTFTTRVRMSWELINSDR